MGWFATLILKLTHKLWQRRIIDILQRSYRDGILSHRQLAVMVEKFDRTQHHEVY